MTFRQGAVTSRTLSGLCGILFCQPVTVPLAVTPPPRAPRPARLGARAVPRPLRQRIVTLWTPALPLRWLYRFAPLSSRKGNGFRFHLSEF
jgi:hypothetical protein